MTGTKICIHCRRALPPSAFGINRSRPDGLQGVCSECRRAEYAAKRAKRRALAEYSDQALLAEIARRARAGQTPGR